MAVLLLHASKRYILPSSFDAGCPPPPTAMGNAGHEANMELARIVPGVDVVVAAPTLVVGAEFPQMVSDH